jgi:hypothetical protein
MPFVRGDFTKSTVIAEAPRSNPEPAPTSIGFPATHAVPQPAQKLTAKEKPIVKDERQIPFEHPCAVPANNDVS